MRRILILLGCVVFLGHAGSAAAQNDRGFGAGIMAGEPTGLAFKYWLKNPKNAIDGGLAWSFTDDSSLHLHGDYLFHSFGLLKVERGMLPFYYGVGARMKFEDDPRFGIRVPVGLEYLFPNSQFDVFVEVVPILDLAPSTEMSLNAALGARIFF